MVMTPTYLFYDLETTGLQASFDQILQFAAIRTDLELNELERTEIRVALNPDVIPSPYAVITHRIGMKQMRQGDNELEALQSIHKIMNTPGTISLGYNTLGFDDEFLRFSFFRNLLTPYTHQYANHCKRMDILPMTTMYYLYHPEVLQWPSQDGKVSLKLENINQCNQLAEGSSHDAMVDVEVTLALARRLQQNASMWEYLTGFFDKNTDTSRSLSLPTHLTINAKSYNEAIITHNKLGYNNQFQAPVLHLGQHTHYKNQSLWLRLDTTDLTQTTEENFKEKAFVIRKKTAESQFILPMKQRFSQRLSEERRQVVEKNKVWLQQNPDIFESIVKYHKNFTYPEANNMDIDASLYTQGFPSKEETALYQKFHTATLDNKNNLIDKITPPRRQQQALRIMARNYPNTLNDSQKEEFQQYTDQIHSLSDTSIAITDYKGEKKLTASTALDDINHLLKNKKSTLDTEQISLLNEMKHELNQEKCQA